MAEKRRFVIGDIHGCIRTFRYLTEEVLNLVPGDTLFLLGDTVDRGPGSKEVLDYIIRLSEYLDLRPVMGNHEFMMLHSAEDEVVFQRWILNGCAQTLVNFGADPLKVNERNSVSVIPSSYFDFIGRWPLYQETEDFLFVHAGLDSHSKDPLKDSLTILWTRNEDAPLEILKGRKLVHGHTPVVLSSIKDRVNDPGAQVINLDGGCVYKGHPGLGHLVALDLDHMKIHAVKNRD